MWRLLLPNGKVTRNPELAAEAWQVAYCQAREALNLKLLKKQPVESLNEIFKVL